MDKTISIYINSLEPSNVVSIYDIDEVSIDILPMDEYKKEDGKENCDEISLNGETSETSETTSNTGSAGFVSFSGKGNRLGSS